MKVCLVGSGIVQIPPKKGGAVERVIQNLAEILSQEHEVTVLDFGPERETLEKDGYEILRIPIGRTNPFVQRVKFGLKSSIEIPKIGPDIIHLHTIFSGLPVCLFNADKKMIYTTHNPAWVAENVGIKNSMVNKLEAVLFRRADRITAVSEYQGECILKKSGTDAEKLSVIHNFVEVERREVERGEKPIVLFLGKHTRHKGIHIFVEAVELIKKEMSVRAISIGPSGRFGEGEGRSWKSRNIDFLGPVSETKKVEFLNKADVILCPTDREGHSLVQLEAQAVGLPVVATDIPPSREAIDGGRTGLLAERTPRDFAEKTVKILRENWKDSHSKHFSKWMKRFSKEEISKKWLELYSELSSQ